MVVHTSAPTPTSMWIGLLILFILYSSVCGPLLKYDKIITAPCLLIFEGEQGIIPNHYQINWLAHFHTIYSVRFNLLCVNRKNHAIPESADATDQATTDQATLFHFRYRLEKCKQSIE